MRSAKRRTLPLPELMVPTASHRKRNQLAAQAWALAIGVFAKLRVFFHEGWRINCCRQ